MFTLVMGVWRKGSAPDSRSEGWEFESFWPHDYIQCPLLSTLYSTCASESNPWHFIIHGCVELMLAQHFTTQLGVSALHAIYVNWGYGATAARLTPDQKVGTSSLSGLMTQSMATSQ